MREYKVVPSIIAKEYSEFSALLEKLRSFSDRVHLDIMDGRFVPNHSLEFDLDLDKKDLFIEAHMMAVHPLRWIRANIDNVNLFMIHISSINKEEWIDTIDYIKFMGKKVGLALNPEVDPEMITPFIEDLDRILIMTVHPGKYGSEFMPKILDKIRWVRKEFPDIDIEVDGGIDDKTIISAKEAGANIFVSGSYIIKARSPEKAYRRLVGMISP